MTAWTSDERAAARAYLQRSEVRLSTVHRTATALLSGAGLMVLLPTIAIDSVETMLRNLLEVELTASHVLLALAVAVLLSVPFIALWMLLRDLTRFYFHAQHLSHARADIFTPRFTLTGLFVPRDELGPDAAAEVAAARSHPTAIELLVPPNDTARARIDRQLDAYGGLGRHERPGDPGRAAGQFELVAARERTLAEEVAKVEHGMARHLLRIQSIVLRYVKALLAILTTSLAVFSGAAIVDAEPTIDVGTEVRLAMIFCLWAPCVTWIVHAPVRWIEQLLRSEGATGAAVALDREFTQMERVATAMASVCWILATAALTTALLDDAASTALRWSGGIVAATTGAVLATIVVARQRSAHTAITTS